MNEKAKDEKIKDEPIIPAEAGDIGEEQLPAGGDKTDKVEWNYAADKAKKAPILPEKVREFLDAL